jgi:plastocyanin
MVAHTGHWSSASWTLLAAFAVLLVVGIALAVVAARGRSGGRAHSALVTPISTAITAAGLLGVIFVAATSGPGLMHSMMGGGDMGSMMASGETARSGTAPVPGAREVRVTANEFSFSPAAVQAKVGETVNLVFDNTGHMFHTFTVGELGLDLRANGGEEIAGSFRAERAGTFAFFCAVSGHAEAGMRGAVTVA